VGRFPLALGAVNLVADTLDWDIDLDATLACIDNTGSHPG